MQTRKKKKKNSCCRNFSLKLLPAKVSDSHNQERKIFRNIFLCRLSIADELGCQLAWQMKDIQDFVVNWCHVVHDENAAAENWQGKKFQIVITVLLVRTKESFDVEDHQASKIDGKIVLFEQNIYSIFQIVCFNLFVH